MKNLNCPFITIVILLRISGLRIGEYMGALDG